MTWPITSPWVTTVGGTQFLATADDPQAEVVCSAATRCGVTSGGGFAGPAFSQDLFSTPAWQKTAVERYLAENNHGTFAAFPTAAGTPGWNPTGRAYPDIAAYGDWFPIVNWDGAIQKQAGTSLSAPMAAALFSLANQALTRDGYDAIGYANPMLYWMGQNCTDAFNDITIGDNTANQSGEPCIFGFPAAPGWDAATGLGSINFGPFVECAKRYQDEVRNVGLEMLPDGSYRGSPTDVGGPTPPTDVGGPTPPTDVGGPTPPTDSGQMTAAAVVLAVLPLLAV
jgi:tripeptidyl-peptidase-1